MNPIMNVTAVPEPSTIVFLLSAGWLITSIVLLCKPRMRVAGIVVLVAPLVLVVVAGALWWLRSADSLAPSQAATEWQPPHRATRTAIHLDSDHDTRKNVAAPPAPSIERDDVVVESERVAVAATPAGGVSRVSIVFLLFGVLVFGGLVATVVLLIFPKTRAIGIALLVGGVLGIAMITAMRFIAVSPTPVAMAPDRTHPRVDASIPVDATKEVEVEPAKPAAKPAVGTVEATGRALVKAIARDEKNPVAATPAAKPASAPAKKPPAWVGAPPHVLGESYQKTIIVGPYPTRQDCDAELPNELQKELNRYVELCMGQPAGTTRVELPYEFLREEVVRGEWEETIQSPRVGQMTQLHVLLQFDRKVKDRILEERQRAVVAGRLWMTGGGLAAMLWLLAVMYGYLRIDLATGGAYRGRLRFAAILAILGPVAAAILVAA